MLKFMFSQKSVTTNSGTEISSVKEEIHPLSGYSEIDLMEFEGM